MLKNRHYTAHKPWITILEYNISQILQNKQIFIRFMFSFDL